MLKSIPHAGNIFVPGHVYLIHDIRCFSLLGHGGTWPGAWPLRRQTNKQKTTMEKIDVQDSNFIKLTKNG